MSDAGTTPVAIIGIGCLYPRAGDASALWANIVDGVDVIGDVPADRWNPADYYDADPRKPDHTYARRGGFLEPADFPPLDFGISPNTLEGIDSNQLLGLLVARQALEDAGYGAGKPFDRSKASVILGLTGTQQLVIPLGARLGHPIWRKALKDAGVAPDVAEDVVQRISDGYVPWIEDSFPGLLGNVAAGRIANRLDLGGTNCVVDAACASSLSAIHLALLELAAGRSDLVLTGGFDVFNDIFMYMCFSKTPALSPTGDSRPFDRKADGTILGEGLGCLVLKRLADAERDGDRIYAVIKSIGTSSDGKGQAIYAPSSAGQVKALKRAYELAGVTPDTIELVEAHGTGTRAGDAAEVAGLTEVYRSAGKAGSWCALGSIKSQLGHTKAAAGASGLIKAALALHHKVLPPTIKVTEPIDALQPGASPFYVNTEKRPWLPSSHPRRAAVSAFGFGGSNFHCVVEEYERAKVDIDWDGRVQLVAFSAPSEAALWQQVESWPREQTWPELRSAAALSRRRFDAAHPHRLLLVLEQGKTDLGKLLDGCRKLRGQARASLPDGAYLGSGAAPGKAAFLFPGQGSQYVGMLRDLACQFPQMQQVLANANELGAGRCLADFIFPQPAFSAEAKQRQEEALRATDIAQPALGAVSLGALRVLEHFGVRADVMAGHSYGELAALCAAGRFDEAALHSLSRQRGRLMAGAGGGAMLAVLAPRERVADLLQSERLDLTLANHNGPSQVVLSGRVEEVDRAADACQRHGLRCQRLAVSAAFHSPLVAGVRDMFQQALAEVSISSSPTPVFANTTGQEYPAEAASARTLLAGQLAASVEFVSQIERMYDAGVRLFVEVGPGSKLTGLVGGILDGREHVAIALDNSAGRRAGDFDLARTLAQLASLAHRVDLTRWDAGVPLEPRARPALTVPISGANYVKSRPVRPPRPVAPPPQRNGTPTKPAGPAIQPETQRAVIQATGSPNSEALVLLQKLAEQTARLHQQFLEGQDRALQAMQGLIQQRPATNQVSMPVIPPESVVAQERTIEPMIVPPVADVPGSPIAADAPGSSIAATLLQVVGDKTGYPVETLQLDMELDADLGIDSIKRVEIFSAIQDQLPHAPAIKPEHLGTLRTLRQVADFLGQNGATPAHAPAARQDHSGILLATVAEKTGYPVETLQLDMELDADLGIDSIKRVEIFSALQDQLPHAPAIKPEHLGTLRTLRQVADFLGRNGVVHKPALAACQDHAKVLLATVAEKTGYPVETLQLDMELDADLGIDSIKRVEIFSAIQDQLPSAPAIKPEHLGTLRTLRQVAEFLAGPVPEAESPCSAPCPAPVVTVPQAAASLQRLILETGELPAGRARLSIDTTAPFWITDDGAGLATALGAKLEAQGVQAQVMDGRNLRAIPDHLAGLVILAPGRVDDTWLRDAFRLVQHAGKSLRQTRNALLAAVSRLNGAFGVGGLPADVEPRSGGLAGLAKTIQHEWPEVRCKAVDLDAAWRDTDEAALALADELLLDGPIEVGLSAERRCGLKLSEASVSMGTLPLARGDVVVVTGGGRGVTAETALALARACQPTLVLLGRTPAPGPEPDWLAELTGEAEIKQALARRANGAGTPRKLEEQFRALAAGRELRDNLKRIEAAGARVIYHSVDVGDPADLRQTLGQVRQEFGPIRGFVHGAGVLADRRVEDKTVEQFDQVYRTKVIGLAAALEDLPIDELKTLVLFSSMSARWGRTGQVDYAMANEVLNKLAQREAQRRPACKVLSLNWGPWDGGMVTPALKKVFAREDVGLIPLDDGALQVVRELAASDGPVEVVILARGNRQSAAAEPESDPRHGLNGSNGPAATVVLERELSVEELPVLRSHVIGGRPVMPMALIIEWLGHGALHRMPGLQFVGFDDLRVLKGIQLDEPRRVRVLAGKAVRDGSGYRVPMELRGQWADGRDILHASATILLAGKHDEPPVAPNLPRGGQALSARAMYDDVLFHGPDLQNITVIEQCSPAGITALLKTHAPAPADWVRRPFRGHWLADPLVLDCAFQMMCFWCRQEQGSVSLPCRARNYRQYRRAFPGDAIRVANHITRVAGPQVEVDMWFTDAAGQVIARLQGYECVLDPSLNLAFRQNHLEAVASL